MVVIDRELCIGSATCVRLAPAVFQLDSSGLAVVVDPMGADRVTVERAANRCPAGAIFLDETGVPGDEPGR